MPFVSNTRYSLQDEKTTLRQKKKTTVVDFNAFKDVK